VIATAALAVAALATAADSASPKFEIQDGDRIVWIGGAIVEREQRYGYWETALHAAFPDKNFTLRNLGWSGDTVRGESRARFDFNQPDAGFKQLVDLTLELKPTVIFVSYGANESFEGKAGLEEFARGLEKLLDALKPAKARVVLFTPLGPIGSEEVKAAEARSKAAELYGEKVLAVAAKHGLRSAESSRYLSGPLAMHSSAQGEVTANGVHLTEAGYRVTADGFLQSLGIGSAQLNWQQLEPLRRAIVAKNQLFFYRWRPQNETYLFGFRKHEQGKNAKEVAEFDPLVAKAEEEIAKLKK
jgi:lysophospholipase L1-like esterase